MSSRIVLGLLMAGGVAAAGQYPRTPSQSVRVEVMDKGLGNIVAVRDVTRTGQTIVGRVVNRSDTPIGDVRLEFEHVFLWQDERHPGRDDPSRRESALLKQTIEPGESVSFQHRLEEPLPDRSDGAFLTKVEPVAVTQLPAGVRTR